MAKNTTPGELLVSGKASFKIEVPYKLISTGREEPKPLIVYLHGFGQNLKKFRHLIGPMEKLCGYHLFIQGPYPLYDSSRKKPVEEWGSAWYLYDGRQEQFLKSMEISSEFIQQIVDRLLKHMNVSRIALVGYSMGGYLAGYFALSRWKHVNELVVIGGRIKTESFPGKNANYKHLNVLALHGKNDKSVKPGPQRRSVRDLVSRGVSAEFNSIEAGHRLSKEYIKAMKEWFIRQGYKNSDMN